jgi:hypothetical protein
MVNRPLSTVTRSGGAVDLGHLDPGAVTVATHEVHVSAHHPYVDRAHRLVDLEHRRLAERPLAHLDLLQTRYIATLQRDISRLEAARKSCSSSAGS